MIHQISVQKARNLIIKGQLLHRKAKSALEVVEQLGYVQIDSISVVQRAHHHVFWSRYPQYKKDDLNTLVSRRKIFEYWSHAASFLPMDDYRFSLIRKRKFKKSEITFWKKDKKVMKYVFDKIKAEGPLQSKDFKSKPMTTTGWWDWRPAKMALESLFMQGDLEISKRVNFQKVYDLTDRVIPLKINRKYPSSKEFARYLIRRTLNHHTLATAREISYLQKSDILSEVIKEIERMLEEGSLTKVQIKGVEGVYYVKPDFLSIEVPKSRLVHILSPFDNFVIQRKKIENLFNFNSQLECYLPQSKRKYGYFSLPILVGNQLVARMDAKADRKKSELKVQSVHWESSKLEKEYKEQVFRRINEFRKFNSCEKIEGSKLM